MNLTLDKNKQNNGLTLNKLSVPQDEVEHIQAEPNGKQADIPFAKAPLVHNKSEKSSSISSQG